MAEEAKQLRTKEEIQKEATELFAAAGSKQFEMKVLEGQIFEINQRLSQCNIEAGKVRQQEMAEIHAKAAEKSDETPPAA